MAEHSLSFLYILVSFDSDLAFWINNGERMISLRLFHFSILSTEHQTNSKTTSRNRNVNRTMDLGCDSNIVQNHRNTIDRIQKSSYSNNKAFV